MGGWAGRTRRDLTLEVKTDEQEIPRFPGKAGGEQTNNNKKTCIPDYSFKNVHGRKFTVSQTVGNITIYLFGFFDPVKRVSCFVEFPWKTKLPTLGPSGWKKTKPKKSEIWSLKGSGKNPNIYFMVRLDSGTARTQGSSSIVESCQG